MFRLLIFAVLIYAVSPCMPTKSPDDLMTSTTATPATSTSSTTTSGAGGTTTTVPNVPCTTSCMNPYDCSSSYACTDESMIPLMGSVSSSDGGTTCTFTFGCAISSSSYAEYEIGGVWSSTMSGAQTVKCSSANMWTLMDDTAIDNVGCIG